MPEYSVTGYPALLLPAVGLPTTVDVGTAIHLENCKVDEAKQKSL
jgi:hypothetical protein